MSGPQNVDHGTIKNMLQALKADAAKIERATVAKPGWVMLVNGAPTTTRNNEPLLVLKMVTGEKRIIIGDGVEAVLNSAILQAACVPILSARTV